MRNWNPIFNMSELKKKLDTHQNTKPEYSMVLSKKGRGGIMEKKSR
jgi:hypothetical protein